MAYDRSISGYVALSVNPIAGRRWYETLRKSCIQTRHGHVIETLCTNFSPFG